MAKSTALEMVQEMLSAISSDEVAAIDDTTEARQAYDHLKIAFEELSFGRQWAFRRGPFTLIPASSTTRPTRFMIPEDVSEIIYLKYNKADIRLIEPEDFQYILDQRDITDTNVVNHVYNGANIAVMNNKAPSYWTSFDDKTIFFDSFDIADDTAGYMTAAKFTGYGVKGYCEWPTSDAADDFVPEMPDKFFPMLRAMARERAFYYLKQMDTPADTRFIRKQKIHLNKTDARHRRKEGIVQSSPNYGRK